MHDNINNSSAAERNKRPIFEALRPWLIDVDTVLEIGSGDATHARYAVWQLPNVQWQTSEAPAYVRRLAAAITDDRALADLNLPPPLALDVRQTWPVQWFDAVYAANVAHIMSWDAVRALFTGVGAHLNPGGLFFLYGPFFDAANTPPTSGNQRFNQALREQNPEQGVRDIADLDNLAENAGLRPEKHMDMPANNRLLIWRSGGALSGSTPDKV